MSCLPQHRQEFNNRQERGVYFFLLRSFDFSNLLEFPESFLKLLNFFFKISGFFAIFRTFFVSFRKLFANFNKFSLNFRKFLQFFRKCKNFFCKIQKKKSFQFLGNFSKLIKIKILKIQEHLKIHMAVEVTNNVLKIFNVEFQEHYW